MPQAKRVLLPFGLSTGMAATHTTIQQKKIYGSGTTALIIKGISETIKNEVKEQKNRFLPMILETLATSILGNPLQGKKVIRGREGLIRACQNF